MIECELFNYKKRHNIAYSCDLCIYFQTVDCKGVKDNIKKWEVKMNEPVKKERRD